MKLKIKRKHQENIKPFINTFMISQHELIKEHVKQLRVYEIQGTVKDIHKRLRWDIFNCALSPNDKTRFFEEVYQYANDTHVDSLLKKLINTKDLLR